MARFKNGDLPLTIYGKVETKQTAVESMSSLLDVIPKNGKMLIISLSVEGFITNLQFLSHFNDDMKSYRADSIKSFAIESIN